HRYATISFTGTPVRTSGGTTTVPLCASRPPVVPDGYGAQVVTAGSRDHPGTTAPVRTTGSAPRAACPAARPGKTIPTTRSRLTADVSRTTRGTVDPYVSRAS